ncbi:MAG: hypothetical protein J2P22_13900 [Nocardioides sp.]|nr:hypothetical protein [Nocardioides sp.]
MLGAELMVRAGSRVGGVDADRELGTLHRSELLVDGAVASAPGDADVTWLPAPRCLMLVT